MKTCWERLFYPELSQNSITRAMLGRRSSGYSPLWLQRRERGVCFSSLTIGESVVQEGTAGPGLSQAWSWCGSLTEMFLHSYLQACLRKCRPTSQDKVSLKNLACEPTELGQMQTANTMHALKWTDPHRSEQQLESHWNASRALCGWGRTMGSFPDFSKIRIIFRRLLNHTDLPLDYGDAS